MKYILRLLLLSFFALVGYGYFLKNSGNSDGDKWIGIGVLILSLVLMPLFIYHRYRNKNIKDYVLKNTNQKKEKSENQ
ncbi:hypothetical protein SY27_09405 [Flavobacterium sp. 316]|uniref:Uncharacterized protein n=1 Tax=Flavobacterium sediminilitoris TaxID=2024526 RepID=A0ABY4HRV2_9FLAO|nr:MULTISPECIES: hypothetical protein [Flavobacterium]KIX20986.1 hypothetical protein SY27_09405 [Flavobacterium sp. 316]UOX35345.1 hypothetical protein LXD69_07445 [Flavobacterium sediminilitoris]